LTPSKKSAHKTAQTSLKYRQIKARKFKSFGISTTNFFFISTVKAAIYTS